MLDSAQAGSLSPGIMLDPVVIGSATTTNSGNGKWIDATVYEGWIAFTVQLGATVGGTTQVELKSADDVNGTNAVSETTAIKFPSVAAGTAAQVQVLVLPTQNFKKRYIGASVVTGSGATSVPIAILAVGGLRTP